MNKKKIFITVLTILVIGLAGYFVLIKNKTPIRLAEPVFSSKDECEQRTGKLCGFRMCDYVPPGKTFEEVCGKGFEKGWAPNPYPPKKQTTINSNQKS